MFNRRFLSAFLLGILVVTLLGWPIRAADLIYLRYGPFSRSISVQAIQTFAETGRADELDSYLASLSLTQRSQLQRALRVTYDLEPRMATQFTYTSSGERLLQEAGELLQTASGQNGFYSLRSATILAAADANGASWLNILRHLPVDMQVNLQRAFALRRQVTQLLQQTAQGTAELLRRTDKTAHKTTLSPSVSQPDLRQPGTSSFKLQTLTLQDAERNRALTVDLYAPDAGADPVTPASVIVMSNGLGAKRDRFASLANHLASHGFAVVIPDHPGSDRDRLRDFYRGLYRENFDTTEFRDRPLDITFLLNELERLNQTQFRGALNLNQVGMFGYSFGGTTALSLAGADIQRSSLESACRSQPFILNISLLYQCQALGLPQPSSLRDPRIKAVYAFLPFGKSLFGSSLSQISIPVLWEASDEDFLTPLMIEQVPAFRTLTTPDRYFVLTRGLPHARINHEISTRLTNSRNDWQRAKVVSEQYHRAMALAFFKAHVAQDGRYRPFLSPAYATELAEDAYPLSFVQSVDGIPAWGD